MDSKKNIGTDNSGDYNSGYWNSGDYNSGYSNSGDWNSGNYNSGNYNSGNRNSGNYNSGYSNSGDWNSGNYNSGNYNSGYWNSGFFNTNEPKLRLFNKDSNMTRSEFVEKHGMIYPELKVTTWVSYKDLPASEQNTDTKNMDGKLKTLTYHEAWAEYWGRASEDDKKWLQSLPNFDAAIFKEITGIDVGAQSLSGKEVTVTVDGKTFIAVIK